MDKPIKILAAGLLTGFLILVANVTYLQVVAADQVLARPGNTRVFYRELSIKRGNIVSADGKVVATSKRDVKLFRRSYPMGELLSNIVGFSSLKLGKSGLERAYNDYLLAQAPPTNLNDYVADLMGKRKYGDDVFLTVDTRIQKAAVEALGDRRGAIVVMRPKSGEILAMATYPRYNPNNIEARWPKLVGDRSSPLFNRAAQGLYPPGSVFKVITASAGLDTDLLTPDTVFDGPAVLRVQGGQVTNYADQGFGTMPFSKALAVSCNTIFAQVGLKLGDRLVNYARAFGLDERTPLDIPVSVSRIPSASEMDKLELAWSAVGQGRVLVTPLQMALTTSAIANGGRMMKPQLVKEIRDFRGRVVETVEPQMWLSPVTPETAATMTELMSQVVARGTGGQARIDGVEVAGKTGTAEPSDKKRTHAWFVGFAPAHDPEVAVAVVVEHGGVGGQVAAPVAKQVIEAVLGYGEVN